MKAALVKSDGSLEVRDYPNPEPGPGDLVVKVAYCGICGSDIHLLERGLLPPDCIIGHELSGHIVSVGDEVEGWKEGDAVVVLPLDPCFECEPCRKGNIQICQNGITRGYGLGINPGGFSEYMLVKPSMLFRVPEGLDMKTAALNEPWSVAFHGVSMSDFCFGARAVVMGAGPIGLLCIYALKASGASEIYVTEPDEFRRERATAAGADMVIDPSKEYVDSYIKEATGSAPDYVFDCAGTANSLDEAAVILNQHGRIVVLGVYMDNARIFPLSWFAKEIRLNFSLGYNLQEFGAGIKLLGKGLVDGDVVTSDVLPLSEIDNAFKMLHGSGHTKVLLDCQAV
jgi:(R,R)-butanediol dehydrogenase/meso-butanediol dehydrogenase/diacetyl reductase